MLALVVAALNFSEVKRDLKRMVRKAHSTRLSHFPYPLADAGIFEFSFEHLLDADVRAGSSADYIARVARQSYLSVFPSCNIGFLNLKQERHGKDHIADTSLHLY